MNNTNTLLILASILAFYFLLSIIIVHIIRKDLSVIKTPLSKYALGKKSIYLTLGFILIGCSEIIISNTLQNNTLASQNLFLAGLGVIIVGFIKMDNVNKKSLQNRTHNFGVILQFLCFPIAVFLLSLTVNNLLAKIYCLATSISTLVLFFFIFGLYKKYMKNEIRYYGLMQKANILLINLWLIIAPITILN